MTFPISNPTSFGAYLPTTYIYDVGELQKIDVNSTEFKELIVRLYLNMNSMLQVLNIKDSGLYLTTTFQTGQQFFNVNNKPDQNRPIYRVVVPFGALPNNTTKSVAHNQNLGTTWSQIRLDISSTNPNTKSIDIPGFDPADITKPINAWVDGTNVNIQTTSNMSAYTVTWVIYEYILN
jgi:hypothetical protein